MGSEDTQFKQHFKANPKGRPRGTGAKQALFKEMVWPHAPKLADKVVEMALEGNEAMIKLLSERLFPRPQDNVVHLDIGEKINEETILKASEAIIRLVADGEILPEEGKTISEMLKNHKEGLALQELTNKVMQLQNLFASMEQK